MTAAQAAGIRIFFVTNRPCESKPGVDDPCPQKSVTIQDLREAGFDARTDNVMLSNERPGWDREKSVRRNYIAQDYRVIMLFGDDLGDFIDCARHKPLPPCSSPATIASRADATAEFSHYWGHGWYVLPNPMHGSWTSVR
jgi:acid phosphatase